MSIKYDLSQFHTDANELIDFPLVLRQLLVILGQLQCEFPVILQHSMFFLIVCYLVVDLLSVRECVRRKRLHRVFDCSFLLEILALVGRKYDVAIE
jgi:hypothetical protein